jgi:hypothetical protein
MWNSCPLSAHLVIASAALPDKLNARCDINCRYIVAEEVDQLGHPNRYFAEHLVESTAQFLQWQCEECSSSSTAFLAVATILGVKSIATSFFGGGSTVNVERSKASNTFTARTEP